MEGKTRVLSTTGLALEPSPDDWLAHRTLRLFWLLEILLNSVGDCTKGCWRLYSTCGRLY